MFTARSRQNPFAKRRREQAAKEAEAAALPATAPTTMPEPPAPKPVQMAASFDSNKSPDHVETPDIAVLPRERAAADELSRLGQEIAFPPTEEQTTQANVVLDIPAISTETQAKIDDIVNRAVPPAADEPKRGRGRPRPAETIARDAAVLDLLKLSGDDGMSKESIATQMQEKEQQVYSSLRQLSKDGFAKTRHIKGRGYRWFAITNEEK